MIDPRNLDTLLHPQFDAAALKAATPIGKGLGASPGAACGKIVFTAEDAEEWAARGEKVVLVRLETSPEDITGMKASQGILTVRGGMTSHAAVVARGMGTCCVSGCGDIAMDEANKKFTLAGKNSTKVTSFQSTVQQVTSMTVLSRQLTLQSQVSSAESWLGLTSTELLKFEQTLIHLLTLRKLVSSVLKVSVFAVQSICSLRGQNRCIQRDDLLRYS
jgi:phosphoenolpyruvate synthase/pyruvate phosphate dikinase